MKGFCPMYTPGAGLLSKSDFLLKLNEKITFYKRITNNKGISYYNIPAAFDIEVSSFYQDQSVFGKLPENKRAIMYVWQFGIDNMVTYGRTWEEFINLISIVKKIMNLLDENRLIVFVHNLPYEFQFIRKRFDWEEVFILSERKPVYANAHGVEFRCSLKLAGGKSLENVGKDLQKYKVEKAVGNLDYEKIRTPLTPLSLTELLYIENDIRVILCYIQEKIEQDGDVTKIPLTNTGYVRNFCRKECFRKWSKYHNFISSLTIDYDEYNQLKRSFQGGFTHANAHYVGKVIENVNSHDFTSSYPSVMVLEKFPMSKSRIITETLNEEQLTELLMSYCCIMDIEYYNISPKLFHEHPISKSKCTKIEGCVADNGRVVIAQYLKMTITEQDFFIYQRFYEYERISISNLRIYEKNYLPKPFIMAILELYRKKTVLKGVEGEEINYMISKNMANAAYGMIVTNPIRDKVKYVNDNFVNEAHNIDEELTKYNSNIRRFIFYPWGVWVTAYARANLFSGIAELGSDYVYSDTDSIKSVNSQLYSNYFDSYNQNILQKIAEVSSYHNIDVSMFSPVTKKGEVKTIGLWDDEGIYDEFKTLGAKRYMVSKIKSGKKEFTLTLAGANKKKTMSYLESIGNPFERFDNNMRIPKEYAGRLIMTYIDDETEGDIVDYTGVSYHYHELSSVHMEPSEYNLTMSDEFTDYLKGLIDFGE